MIDPLIELNPQPGLCPIHSSRDIQAQPGYSSPGVISLSRKVEEPLKTTRAQTEELEIVTQQQAWQVSGRSLFDFYLPELDTIPERGVD